MNFIKKVILLVCSISILSCNSDDNNDTQEFSEVLIRVDNQTNFLVTEVFIDNTEYTDIQPQTISSYIEFVPFGNIPPSYFTVNTTDENVNSSWVVDYFEETTIDNGFYTLTLTINEGERIRGNLIQDE